MTNKVEINRRKFIGAGAALGATLAAPAVFAQSVAINTSSFRTAHWQDYFSSTNGGAILVDLKGYALHFWNSDQTIYKLYPIAVPLKEEFIRRGDTTVTEKREGPSWSPTASMLQRDPTLPRHIGPGPENPLGTHALYLGWQYYRIHGNNDTRKIGRTSSNGCIGLYNENIAELFGLANTGTKVHVF